MPQRRGSGPKVWPAPTPNAIAANKLGRARAMSMIASQRKAWPGLPAEPSTERPSLRDAFSNGDTEQMRAAISLAQREGRLARWRVQLPCLVLGLGVFFSSLALTTSAGYQMLNALGWCQQATGIVIFLMAVLPVDDRMVSFSAGIVGLSMLSAGAVLAATVLAPMIPNGIRGDECTLRVDFACYERAFNVAVPVFSICVYTITGIQAGSAACRKRKSARALLETTWRLLTRSFTITSCVLLARFVISASWQRKIHPADNLLLGIWLGILASFTRSRTLRLRVQSLLAARGEQLLTAASVAAFLGNADAEQLISRAQSSFRAVPLSLVKEEHFLSNEPDCSLFALSEPIVLGQCDAFVR